MRYRHYHFTASNPQFHTKSQRLFFLIYSWTNKARNFKSNSESAGFLLLIQETSDLNWSLLTLLPHLRFAAYVVVRLRFLFLILSSAGFFCKLSAYSSETTLDKFYPVNVIKSNDLSYGEWQQKDENIISRTAIDLVPRT